MLGGVLSPVNPAWVGVFDMAVWTSLAHVGPAER